jgi:hypothetical protein
MFKEVEGKKKQLHITEKIKAPTNTKTLFFGEANYSWICYF